MCIIKHLAEFPGVEELACSEAADRYGIFSEEQTLLCICPEMSAESCKVLELQNCLP
jgi:hypothetical protein